MNDLTEDIKEEGDEIGNEEFKGFKKKPNSDTEDNDTQKKKTIRELITQKKKEQGSSDLLNIFLGKIKDVDNEFDQVHSNEFNSDKSEYTKVFLYNLEANGILKDIAIGSEYDSFTIDEVLDLSEKELPFVIIDDEIVLIENDGTTSSTGIDNFNKKILTGWDWENIDQEEFARLLPEVKFDVSQGGIKERMKETCAAYKLCVINKAFDGIWNEQIIEVINSYDFINLTGPITFAQLLENVFQNSSLATRILINCCAKKLMKMQTKKEGLFDTMLTPSQKIQLSTLDVNITVLRNSFDKQVLEVPQLDWELLKLREELVDNIEGSIDDSNVGIIYRIKQINVQYLNQNIRTKIETAAELASLAIKKKEAIIGKDSLIRLIERRLRRRAFREFLASWKLDLLQQYLNDEVFVFPKKK
jgi:hypothetical protein